MRKDRISKIDKLTLLKDVRKRMLKGATAQDIKEYLAGLGYNEGGAQGVLHEVYTDLKDYFDKNKAYFQQEYLARYNYLYQQSLENNNLRTAKDILDSMVKLTGAGEFNKQKVEFDGDSPIVISFGFDKNEEE